MIASRLVVRIVKDSEINDVGKKNKARSGSSVVRN